MMFISKSGLIRWWETLHSYLLPWCKRNSEHMAVVMLSPWNIIRVKTHQSISKIKVSLNPKKKKIERSFLSQWWIFLMARGSSAYFTTGSPTLLLEILPSQSHSTSNWGPSIKTVQVVVALCWIRSFSVARLDFLKITSVIWKGNI